MPIVKDSSRIKYLRLLRGKQGGYDTGCHGFTHPLIHSSAVAPLLTPKSDNTHAPLPDGLP